MTAQTDGTYDLVILGAGSGGYACALRARQLGLTVALVEEDKVGGTCLHRGCIPTKALLHSAEIAEAARHGSRLGLRTSFDGVDVASLHAYKDKVVGQLFKGLTGLVRQSGAEVVEGRGRLVDASTVEVGEGGDARRLVGRTVVLATGSAPRTLPGIEIGPRVMTSDEVLRIEEIPGRVAVLGGGVIGVELASVMAGLGAQVTVVEALDRLVAAEEPSISKVVERTFKKRGITALTGARVAGVDTTGSGATVRLESGDPIEVDLVIVAVGRGPRSEGIGLEEAGVATERGFVTTDERLRTSVEGVRAVGDLVPGLQLAHRGFGHGIFVAEDVAGLSPAPVLDVQIPRVTYCDPEIASVGMTAEQAHAAGHEVESVQYPLGGNGRSIIRGTTGSITVVREQDGPVLGVHMVGIGVSELVGEAQLMVGWEAHPEEVASLVHAHPTQGEALGEAAMLAAGRPLHAHA
ncbi:dihydrolipoyl dehydrogenase [Janibacter sp. YIM B02568]|uniref:dihydrolipoyl dehydrogenase n=1 Tax=Janibacter endophyticus TaxID=2806261 RepID=UPI00194E2C39|nr:dihydrolipoyl dehydrogenase [Janibacter endophyticus]MBM6546170.1 dihydrolipoyl dehydrogenase [Janibacter endophyticus]